VSRTLNRRSVERVSLEAGYRCDAAKKLIPLTGWRVSQKIRKIFTPNYTDRYAMSNTCVCPRTWLVSPSLGHTVGENVLR
jgi:hypothetical protein